MRSFFRNKAVQIVLSIAYLFLLIYLLFFAPFRTGTTTEINLIPFKNIFALTSYTFQYGEDWWHWIVNVPGNIVAFIPLPFILNLFVKIKLNFWTIIFMSLFVPLIPECIQYFFQNGSPDIDDLILNFLGMMIGYYFLIKKQKQPAT